MVTCARQTSPCNIRHQYEIRKACMLAQALLFAHHKSHLCQQHQQQLHLCQQQELPLQFPLRALQQLPWQLPQSLHSQQLGPMHPGGILQTRRPSRFPSLVLHLHLPLLPQMAPPLVLPGQPNRELCMLCFRTQMTSNVRVSSGEQTTVSSATCKTTVKRPIDLLIAVTVHHMDGFVVSSC